MGAHFRLLLRWQNYSISEVIGGPGLAHNRGVRVGLVFGGGGVLGGAWMIGGLNALVDETRWNVREAEVVVGTSAGAVIGTVGVVGQRDYFQLPESPSERVENPAPGGAGLADDLLETAQLRAAEGARRRIPGSAPLFWAGLRGEHPRPVLATLSGLVPSGRISTRAIQAAVAEAVPSGWPASPKLWITATDYETGRLVVFGRPGEPKAELPRAVAASCAVPGLYEPVEIGGRAYVDGGVGSVSNLDLLAGRGLDLVVVFNPLSARHRRTGLNPLLRAVWRWHRRSHNLLLEEAVAVRRGGTRVFLIEPTLEELEARGHNLMDAALSDRVRDLSRERTREQVRALRIADLLGPSAAVPARG